MVSIFRRFRKLLVLLMLASVSFRVLTGAAEAQVNFSSLIVEQYKSYDGDFVKASTLHGVFASNPADASSIPDNQKTFATYKKYLTPESSLQLPSDPPMIPFVASDVDGILVNSSSQRALTLPKSHSPPAVMPALLHTCAISAVQSTELENYFGKIAINHSVGEFRSHQL